MDLPPPPDSNEAQPPPRAGGSVLVYDALAPAEGANEAPARPSLFGASARASRLHNQSTVVPQGALIPAVLETAIDSSRPGFARALVSRDVRSYDGSRILIPRGSRLLGEYRADVTPGQKRALVTWMRLDRPDGATIALESPVADPAGRTGVRGSVNTHFFERFGSAFLQTALSIGQNLALRSADSSVVVALPGSFQGAASATDKNNEIPPTIKVKQGASITVFVARDLNFAGVEAGR
ncbi:MAG: TrbI/VirB10 family protein [Sphingopyxis sp.]|nr:TrbI/VirB10 family protein [Sphingopyxis sp.]